MSTRTSEENRRRIISCPRGLHIHILKCPAQGIERSYANPSPNKFGKSSSLSFTSGTLVKNQRFRVGHQPVWNRQPLEHPFRIRSDWAVRRLLQVHLFKYGADARTIRRAPETSQFSKIVEVTTSRKARFKNRAFMGVANAIVCAGNTFLAQHAHLTRGRKDESHQ